MRLTWAALAALGAACSAGGGGTHDDGAGLPDPDSIAPPSVAEPARPVFTPCPSGWRTETANGLPVCEPWPAAGRDGCAPGEALFPGDSACARIGSECPTGPWRESLPDDLPVGASTLFVSPSGVAGAAGTRDSPTTLSDALSRSNAGTVVLLSRGTHRGGVYVPEGVTVLGACTADTILESTPEPTLTAAITLAGPGATLRDVQILAGGGPAIAIGDVLDHLDDDFRHGLPREGSAGTVRVRDVLVSAAVRAGIVVAGRGNVVVADDLVISEVVACVEAGCDDILGGDGVSVGAGGRFEGRRVLIEDVADAAVRARWEGATVAIEDAAVHGGLAGLVAWFGAELGATRSVVEDFSYFGVMAACQSTADDRQREVCSRARASVALDQVVIRRVRSDGRSLPDAIAVLGQASLDATRLRIEDADWKAIYGQDSGAAIVASDVLVRDVRSILTTGPGGAGYVGRAVDLHWHAEGAFDRVEIEGAGTFGAMITADSTLRLRDARISASGTAEPPPCSEGRDIGAAALVVLGATLMAERCLVSVNRDVGIVVLSAESAEGRAFAGVATLRDVLIEGTVRTPCCGGSTTCAGAGRGIAIGTGARVDASSFVIRDAGLCGVQIEGEADLAEGEVARNVHAICLGVGAQDYELSRLSHNVRYVDNSNRVDSTGDPPLPQPIISDR